MIKIANVCLPNKKLPPCILSILWNRMQVLWGIVVQTSTRSFLLPYFRTSFRLHQRKNGNDGFLFRHLKHASGNMELHICNFELHPHLKFQSTNLKALLHGHCRYRRKQKFLANVTFNYLCIEMHIGYQLPPLHQLAWHATLVILSGAMTSVSPPMWLNVIWSSQE